MIWIFHRTSKHLAIILSLFIAPGSPLCNAYATDKYESFITIGSVISTHDGDTIKLKTSDRGILKIRLSGADAPETGQAYWKASRGQLRSLVSTQPTKVDCYKKDRYGREVCNVYVAQLDIGQELIRRGVAWYAAQFAAELSEQQRQNYRKAEEEARRQKQGIWTEPNPMAPWDCRKLRRSGQRCR